MACDVTWTISKLEARRWGLWYHFNLGLNTDSFYTAGKQGRL